MSTHKHTRRTAVRARVNRIWSELDYASRRMIDIRTGAAFVTGQEKSRRRAAHRPRSPPIASSSDEWAIGATRVREG